MGRIASFLARIIPRLPLVFTLATRTHWRDAWSWLGYTLLGGLLPFWGTALVLLLIRRGQSFGTYFQNGELAVFCAGVLASAIPVMWRRVKDAPVEHPGSLNFLAVIGLAVALLLFASVTITRQVNLGSPATPFLVLNGPAVLYVSLLLFAASICLGFLVELTNNVRLTTEDLQAFETQRETTLAQEFAKARKEQP